MCEGILPDAKKKFLAKPTLKKKTAGKNLKHRFTEKEVKAKIEENVKEVEIPKKL